MAFQINRSVLCGVLGACVWAGFSANLIDTANAGVVADFDDVVAGTNLDPTVNGSSPWIVDAGQNSNTSSPIVHSMSSINTTNWPAASSFDGSQFMLLHDDNTLAGASEFASISLGASVVDGDTIEGAMSFLNGSSATLGIALWKGGTSISNRVAASGIFRDSGGYKFFYRDASNTTIYDTNVNLIGAGDWVVLQYIVHDTDSSGGVDQYDLKILNQDKTAVLFSVTGVGFANSGGGDVTLDRIGVTGLGGGTHTPLGGTFQGGLFDNFTVTAIPEPGSMASLLGLAMAVVARRSRKNWR